MKRNFTFKIIALAALFIPGRMMAQTRLTIKVDKPVASVSPRLFGLMTEEINFSYDGGIYGELVRNRILKDSEKGPDHWRIIKDKTDSSNIQLDTKHPVNKALTVCLKAHLSNDENKASIVNEGWWGFPVKPSSTYKGSVYIMAEDGGGPVTISLMNPEGDTTFASTTIQITGSSWKKVDFQLVTTKNQAITKNAILALCPAKGGDYYFTLLSLFLPTYNNTPNGNRTDIMELLAGMHPSFLRLPGGNYLEGDKFSTRFNWKNTLGPIDMRAGHQGTWGYRSSDGLGLLEYLQWCEDLHMEPLLAVFAGYTLNRDYLPAGPFLKPFVDEALEEIEYVTGDTTTIWGKKRAMDGHPKPFPLKYVEVGNEDGFDRSGSYDGRFSQFYDAIKSKYPNLQVISTAGGKDWLGQQTSVTSRKPEIVDEHYYRSSFDMESDADHYDKYDRNGPKVFVGEWATREGSPTPNFNSALGDAAWMTGMLRNADLVIMSCSAPLFVNVNPGGMQWSSDLIGYNILNSYGSPSYYAQVMFNTFKGDQVIGVSGENIPTQLQKLNHKDSLAHVQPKTYPSLFYVATKDSKTGTIYLNVVNAAATGQQITIDFQGAARLERSGKAIVMKADKPEDTNTITDPQHIVPVTVQVKGVSSNFTYNFKPYSITILELKQAVK